MSPTRFLQLCVAHGLNHLDARLHTRTCAQVQPTSGFLHMMPRVIAADVAAALLPVRPIEVPHTCNMRHATCDVYCSTPATTHAHTHTRVCTCAHTTPHMPRASRMSFTSRTSCTSHMSRTTRMSYTFMHVTHVTHVTHILILGLGVVGIRRGNGR